jgi:hypothetical protein
MSMLSDTRISTIPQDNPNDMYPNSNPTGMSYVHLSLYFARRLHNHRGVSVESRGSSVGYYVAATQQESGQMSTIICQYGVDRGTNFPHEWCYGLPVPGG